MQRVVNSDHIVSIRGNIVRSVCLRMTVRVVRLIMVRCRALQVIDPGWGEWMCRERRWLRRSWLCEREMA